MRMKEARDARLSRGSPTSDDEAEVQADMAEKMSVSSLALLAKNILTTSAYTTIRYSCCVTDCGTSKAIDEEDINMSDSDSDYAGDPSNDDSRANQASTGYGTRSTGPVRGAAGSATRGGDTNDGSNRRTAAWEVIQRSWDGIIEGADGSINSTVEGLREAGKRQRYVLYLE